MALGRFLLLKEWNERDGLAGPRLGMTVIAITGTRVLPSGSFAAESAIVGSTIPLGHSGLYYLQRLLLPWIVGERKSPGSCSCTARDAFLALVTLYS